ncbi:hypothetical protein [Vibrio vulnificus YJ016]|uniref:Uncharacterized protein n=1 Tax=Vibrio vulnificus (strain YJ016) TaxID=196600 RepID=Q7MJZ3_VIBVY|nr:hypothetical protein [Vibrio vulnificus YJ016]
MQGVAKPNVLPIVFTHQITHIHIKRKVEVIEQMAWGITLAIHFTLFDIGNVVDIRHPFCNTKAPLCRPVKGVIRFDRHHGLCA